MIKRWRKRKRDKEQERLEKYHALPRYNEFKHCPKCGDDLIDLGLRRWWINKQAYEVMRRRCFGCDHHWHELPLDYEAEAKE